MRTKTDEKHFYQFYKGREDLFHVVIPFLRLGLENGEACLWVVSSAVGVLEALEAFQRECDLMRFFEKGQLLVIPAERWYLNRERFSERKVLQRFQKFIQERDRRGFSTFRGVGDMGWLETSDWPKFQLYEGKLHRWFQTQRFTAICAYPIERCSLAETQDILDCHDRVFLSKV